MRARTVAEWVAEPRHSGPLHGATVLGEASAGRRLVVRVGLWIEGRRIWRARFQASTCATLLAYADLACDLIESGEPLGAIDGWRLRRDLHGVHPTHFDRAELVVEALRSARQSWPFEEACNERCLRVLHAQCLLHPGEDDRPAAGGETPRCPSCGYVLFRRQQLPPGSR